MSKTSDILFEYLRDVIYNPSDAALDISKLDSDYVMLGKGLVYFAQCFFQCNELAEALSVGDLDVALPPPENEISAPLKTLHACLRYLTWQTQQVARGDYSQRVDFMNEFSNAFNLLVAQLAERKLENDISHGQGAAISMEQSNQLLSKITQSIPQQIIVIDRKTHELLFMNESAQNEIINDNRYPAWLLNQIADDNRGYNLNNYEISYPDKFSRDVRYLSVMSYFLEWKKSDAEAFVITDVTNEKNQIKELEKYAYRDTMTHLHNRFSGILTLNKWLEDKIRFSLVFVDLDRLKYINDVYGHKEGDHYIITVSKHLRVFSPDSVASRIGGDEFMVLAPDISYNETCTRMERINQKMSNDPYLKEKSYVYSISYGIVFIGDDNNMSSSDILSLADARMYEHKRSRRMIRAATL